MIELESGAYYHIKKCTCVTTHPSKSYYALPYQSTLEFWNYFLWLIVEYFRSPYYNH